MNVFLLTDIEGSTRMWELEPQQARSAVARHDEIIAQIVPSNNGRLIKERGEGDSHFIVFDNVTDAANCALQIQKCLQAETWQTSKPVKVRMAIHLGEAEYRAPDYYGAAVNRCARLRAIAHGEQILISAAAFELLPETYSTQDLGQHRLKDLQRAEHVYQLLEEGLRTEFPALLSIDLYPNNLPVQRTSFVGRDFELQTVSEMLMRTRMLTITGVGGGGKTRLALQTGAEVAPSFPEGVWFVDLSPIHDGEVVLRALAAALGLREVPGFTLEQTIIEHIKGKKMLLMLDNCEHVIHEAAELAQNLLDHSPDLRILATSREQLGIAGEQLFRIPALFFPKAPLKGGLRSLLDCGAVQLLVDRVRENRHTFELTEENAKDIVEICRKLDGIPFAIELAAARLKSASAQEIAARIDERFRLLTGGNRLASFRQQTLKAMMDWSYELLTHQERLLLERLSIFQNGWSVAAAEAICSGPDLDQFEIFDLLASLVDKSLVSPVERDGDIVRYVLLQTVREYAAQKLAAEPANHDLEKHYVQFFVQTAEEAQKHLTGHDSAVWLDQLEAEHDNFRYAIALADPLSRLRIAGALWRYWYTRGHLTEGRESCALALASQVQDDDEQRAKCLLGAGVLAWGQQDLDVAESFALASLSLYEKLDDGAALGSVLSNLGLVAVEKGDLANAEVYFSRSLGYRAQMPDRLIANTLNNRGILAWKQNQPELARSHYEECLAIRKKAHDESGAADTMLNLGLLAIDRRDYLSAENLFNQALDIYNETHYKHGKAATFENLAILAVHQADTAKARENLAQSEELFRELEEPTGIQEARFLAACCDILEGKLDKAIEILSEALPNAQDREPELHVDILRALAAVASLRGRFEESVQLFEEARKVQVKAGLGAFPIPIAFMIEAEDKARNMVSLGTKS